jgi:hypothetical protein
MVFRPVTSAVNQIRVTSAFNQIRENFGKSYRHRDEPRSVPGAAQKLP